MRDWISPRRTVRAAKDAVWSKDRSGLLPLVSFLGKDVKVVQTGMPVTEEGQIAFLRASRRAHMVWRIALLAIILIVILNNIVFSANIFANMISAAMLMLAVVEITKYAYFIWHYHTMGSFRSFLTKALQNPWERIFLARGYR